MTTQARRQTCYWCQHRKHAAICTSAWRSGDAEGWCGCERFDTYRNGLLEDMIRSSWQDAEGDLSAIEAEARAPLEARIAELEAGLGYIATHGPEDWSKSRDVARALIHVDLWVSALTESDQ